LPRYLPRKAAATLERLDAVPPELTQKALTAGGPNARYWPGLRHHDMANDGVQSVQRERAALLAAGKSSIPCLRLIFWRFPAVVDAGAFGAGLLLGWTDLGTRPEFKIVTGVSTGGLIAPFAYLGPKYDLYCAMSIPPSLPRMCTRRAASSLPLQRRAGRQPPAVGFDCAIRHAGISCRSGSRTREGTFPADRTTNLDARRPVIWNMGAIASSKDPRAIDLFRDIMLASAAIPGAFSRS